MVTTNAIDVDGGGAMPPTDGSATLFGAHTIIFAAATVPEPASAGLVGFMFIAVALRRRRLMPGLE